MREREMGVVVGDLVPRGAAGSPQEKKAKITDNTSQKYADVDKEMKVIQNKLTVAGGKTRTRGKRGEGVALPCFQETA